MYNKKVLREATKNLDRTKAPAKKKDMIIDPMGQWNHPGQNTRIPGNDITMQDVPYPVWAVPNIGMPQMMYPEQNYNFPGAEYVDEYPQMQKGGISFKDLIEVDYPTEMFKETATWNPDGTYSTIKKYYDQPVIKRPYAQYLDEWANTTPEGKRIVRNAQDRLREVKNKKALWEREQEVKGATEEERKKLMLQPVGEYSFQKGGDISIPDLNQYEDGGEYDLTQEEINDLIAQGYEIEDVDTDEYAKGGTPRSLPKKKGSKGYSRSLTATNKLFAQSTLTKKSKSKKNKIFDPTSKYFEKGGFQDDLGKHRKLLRDWTYGASIGMLHKAQDGESVIQSVTPWEGAPGVTGDIMTPPVIYEGKDVTIKAQAPEWAGYQKEYQKANPWERYLSGEQSKYIRKHKGLNKLAGVTQDNFPEDAEERIRQEYNKKMNSYITKRLGQHFGFNPRKRGEWLDLLTNKEQQIVAGSKYGSKLQPDVWSRTLSGLRSIYNATPKIPHPFLPLETLKYFTGDITTPIPGYTERENREALNNPFEAFEVLAPLDIPGIVIANKMKNMNAENPSWYSGEMMSNVDYGDVAAVNPLTLLDVYALPKGAINLGKTAVRGTKALSKGVKTAAKKINTTAPLKNVVKSGLGDMDMSKHVIKNVDYYTQLLNTYNSKALPAANRKFYKDLIANVKKQDGVVTERQLNELKRLETGNFDFVSKGYNKGYQKGGVTEEIDYQELELTPEEIDWYLANGYELEDLGEVE